MRATLLLPVVALGLAFTLACGAAGGDGPAPAKPAKPAKPSPRKAPAPAPVGDPTPIPDGAVRVQVNPDGSFTPASVQVEVGQTVAWVLSDRYRDSVAPLKGAPGKASCRAIAPYEGGPDDPTGPMPRNASGLFVLNAEEEGLVSSRPQAPFGKGPVPALEPKGLRGAVMDHHWASDAATGAYLRLRWDRIEPRRGVYDWGELDREVAKAVAAGKLYSVSVKAGKHGTPPWIFDEGVKPLVFRDGSTHDAAADCKCGVFMTLGSPTDPRYEALYFEMLEALADHLAENAAAYRHLAYVKPSGANLFSNEPRLPKRCTCEAECPGTPTCDVPAEYADLPHLQPDGRMCNTAVWADAGYTPQKLKGFFERQNALLAKRFPEKDFMYMLIQAGWPQVTDRDTYLTCGMDTKDPALPGPTATTHALIKGGYKQLGERMAVQHAGAREDEDANWMLGTAPAKSQIIGLQTTHETDRADRLGRTFARNMDTSEVTMFEVYEEAFWDADWRGTTERSDGGRTLADWNEALHARRRAKARGDEALRDPFPTVHLHTFTRPGAHDVVVPRHCGSDANAPVGHVDVVR